MGHQSNKCNGTDRRMACLRCGGEEHRVKDCDRDPFCPICNQEGHRADSTACPVYRRALTSAWRGRNQKSTEGEREQTEKEAGGGSKTTKALQITRVRQSNMMLIVLQANLNRSAAAHDIVLKAAAKVGADITVTSEPNKKISKKAGWIEDKTGDVAFLFLNRKLEVDEVRRGRGFLKVRMGNLTIYGRYCSPNCTLTSYEGYIERLWAGVASTDNEKIGMGDMNAKATEWGPPAQTLEDRY